MQGPLTFRLALPPEQRALEELQRRASLIYEEDRQALLDHPDAIELPMEQITGGCAVVADQQGEIVGFAVVLRRDDGDAELNGLFVEPSQWRQGIGRALVEQTEAMALANGAGNLWVIANSRALDFYNSCGFLPIGEVPTRFRPGLRMRKPLVSGDNGNRST